MGKLTGRSNLAPVAFIISLLATGVSCSAPPSDEAAKPPVDDEPSLESILLSRDACRDEMPEMVGYVGREIRAVSPDQSWLVVSRATDQQYEFSLVNPKLSIHKRVVHTNGTMKLSDFTFSPDSKFLTFVASRWGLTVDTQVFRLNYETGEVAVIPLPYSSYRFPVLFAQQEKLTVLSYGETPGTVPRTADATIYRPVMVDLRQPDVEIQFEPRDILYTPNSVRAVDGGAIYFGRRSTAGPQFTDEGPGLGDLLFASFSVSVEPPAMGVDARVPRGALPRPESDYNPVELGSLQPQPICLTGEES